MNGIMPKYGDLKVIKLDKYVFCCSFCGKKQDNCFQVTGYIAKVFFCHECASKFNMESMDNSINFIFSKD